MARLSLIHICNPTPLFSGVAPYEPGKHEISYGSTDVGDVSWVTPTAQCWGACYAYGTPFHSWQMVAQGKLSLAHKGMVHAGPDVYKRQD